MVELEYLGLLAADHSASVMTCTRGEQLLRFRPGRGARVWPAGLGHFVMHVGKKYEPSLGY
jgi:hypothetical protein